MKTAAFFVTAAAALVAAAPASAQDSADGYDFTGPRIEGQLGYEFVSASPRNIQDFQGRGDFGDDSIDENATYGAEVGYDVKAGGVLLGGYLGLDFGDTKVQSINSPYQFKVGRQITAGLRVGTEMRGALLYGKLGYSNARLEEVVLTGGNPALFADYDRNRNGLHVGAGFEVPLTDGLYGRFDYSYHEFEKFRIGTTQDLEFSRHRLMGGIGFRF